MASVLSASIISVNPLTNDPDRAWDKIKNSINKTKLEPMPLDTPIHPNKVKQLSDISKIISNRLNSY